MKDLFTGSLGKISNIGGSRIYTIPTTVEVSGTSYEISARVQGEFVTHSLDGRLWIYQRGTRYGALALKFNPETEELEFATSRTITLTNERILARGIDWILTSKNIYMVSDESPYILSASLYDSDIPEKYLYSILRSNSNTIDPFTKEAWGKSELNGNSDGSGYFSNDTELLKPAGSFVLDKSYSVLPSVGDWQILPNFLLRRPDAALNESYNGQENLRPLIPLEFNKGGNPSYGCGYEHDISLAMIDGELWGRGFLHIGKVKILPAVFDESGEVLEYYLYISPEYPYSPFDEKESSSLDANSDWLKLKVAQFGGYLSEQSDSLSDGLVEMSADTRIFSLQDKEYSEQVPEGSTGKLYVDLLSSERLILHDKGAKFLNGADYECKNLSQWLAPSGKVESISDGSVVSSFDGTLLNTLIPTGFNRQLLRTNNPELTAKSYSGSRLILSDYEVGARKSFHVNKFSPQLEENSQIAWEDIYKSPVEISFWGMIENIDLSNWEDGYWPVFSAISSLLPASYQDFEINDDGSIHIYSRSLELKDITLNNTSYRNDDFYEVINAKIPCSAILVFRNIFTGIRFFCKCPSIINIDESGEYSAIVPQKYWDWDKYDTYLISVACKPDYINSHLDTQEYLKCVHVILFLDNFGYSQGNIGTYIVFLSNYDPSQFDFDAELLRSEKI